MARKNVLLFFSVLLFQQFAFAISLSSNFNLFRDGVVVDSEGKSTRVYAKILCRKGSVTCGFTEFYEGKKNAYDPLLPWFMDDNYSAPDLRDVTIVYQTGDILFNQQVIGKANTIHRAFGAKETIEFYVPITIDSDARTLVIGQ